jgi:hypothetical protein
VHSPALVLIAADIVRSLGLRFAEASLNVERPAKGRRVS